MTEHYDPIESITVTSSFSEPPPLIVEAALVVEAATGFKQSDFNSLLKILAVAALKLRGTKVAAIKKGALTDKDKVAAAKVMKALDVKPAIITTLYDNLLKVGVKAAVATFIPEFRKGINNSRIKHDVDAMSGGQRDVLNSVLTLLKNPASENAFTNLQRRISAIESPEITKAYIGAVQEELGDTTSDSVLSEIRKVVKQLTKRDATSLTSEEQKKFRASERTLPLLRQYLNLKKKLGLTNSNVIRSAVAAANKPFITLKALAAYMKANGVKETTIHPTLFKSKFIGVDIDGNLVDNRGVKLTGGGDIKNHKNKIVINPNYKPDPKTRGNNWIYYVETNNATTGKVTINRAQPTDIVAARREDKFGRVSVGGDGGIDKIKAKWRAKMKIGKNLEDPTTVYAFFAEFLYLTASRVGTKEKGVSAGNDTHGAANFLIKHIVKGKTGTGPLAIKYPVKSGKLQTFVLDASAGDEGEGVFAKKLIDFIRKKAAGRDGNEILFTVNGKRMNTQLFTAALKKMGVPFKPHDYRSLRGTEIASKELPKALLELKKAQKKAGGKHLPESQVHKIFEAAISKVGAQLGHVRRAGGAESVTPATAIAYYVSPKLMVDWYKQAGYAPNTKVRNAAAKSGIKV